MAYTRAALPAIEQTLMSNDKPILFGHNGLYLSGNSAFWGVSDSDTTDNDDEDDYPSARLYDGYDHLQSAPDSADTTWYLHFRFTGSAITFDSLALLNCTLTNCTSIELSIADNSAQTSNQWTTTISHNATENPATNTFNLQSSRRIVTYRLLDSGTPQRITNLVYARLKFTMSSAAIPFVGEVMLGRRRQLKHAPDVPWAAFHRVIGVDRHESLSGVVTDYVRYTNRRRIDATLRTADTTYAADLESFYTTDTRGGRDPFLWCDNPSTAPKQSALMKLDSDTFMGPSLGPVEREWRFSANEQGPNFVGNE
jgi:hypothetical protein